MTLKKTEITYCRKIVFSVITLTIMIVSVYSNSFKCSWHFDDMPNIVENPRLHMEKLNWQSLKKAFFSDRNNPHFPYRPVACLSFALNYYFGKLNVSGYHLVNLAIHLISSIFLFLFVYRTLEYLALTKRWTGDTYFVALLSTVLWAVNPIQTQAITYIVQRMAAMAAMFYIIGMYCYLLARTAEARATKVVFYGFCGLCFLLAIGSKENAAMFPISIFLFEAVIIQQDPVYFIRSYWISICAALGLTILVGLGYFIWKTGGLPDLTVGYRNRPFTMSQRLLTEPRVLLFYVSLLFYPMPNRLNVAHDFTLSTSLLSPPTTIAAILTIVGLILLAIMVAKKKPLISFVILFYFLNHIIESSIFPLELVFEHRNYLPSMFIFLPVAIGFGMLLSFYQNNHFMRFVFCGFIVALLVGLGHSTLMRNFSWRNEISLWIDAVDKSPNIFRPHHNLAKAYSDAGYKKKAIAEYLVALQKRCSANKDEKYLAYYNLGYHFYMNREYQKAKEYYRKSIELQNTFWSSHNNLGIILANEGKFKEALKEFKTATKLTTQSVYPRANLGFLLVNIKKPKEGIRHLEKALQMHPDDIQTMKRLAVAYLKANKPRKAACLFERVLRTEIRESKINPVTTMFLAEAYSLSEKKDKAIEKARTILKSFTRKRLENFIHEIEEGQSRLDRLVPDKNTILTILAEAYKKEARELSKLSNFCIGELDKK